MELHLFLKLKSYKTNVNTIYGCQIGQLLLCQVPAVVVMNLGFADMLLYFRL